ncbi:MAG: hypothetical protein Q8N71_00200, partial [candidate division Zixibacteria bacterium]|nr:hypothetical protein [candidate division Zixibacteria bacterium]
RQSLIFSKGSFLTFFTRPISAVAIILSIILLIIPFITYFVKGKEKHKPSTENNLKEGLEV